MNKRTIGQLIFSSGALLVALLIGVSLAAFYGIHQMTKDSESLRDDVMPGVVLSANDNQDLEEGFIDVLLAGQAATTTERDQFLTQAETPEANVARETKGYADQINDPVDAKNFQDFTSKQTEYLTLRKSYVDLVRQGNGAAATDLLKSRLRPAFLAYSNAGSVLLDWNSKAGDGLSREMVASASRTSTIIGAISLVSLLLGAGLSFVITRHVNRSLRSATSVLSEAAAQISAASETVSATSQSLADGASRQAASVEETSASLEEISSMTQRNAEGAKAAQALASAACSSVESGTRQMDAMSSAMSEIRETSANVGKILKTIDEIAFQTNILALNAAVEAARAGEAGAGFAVVAGEVRTLAQRAAEASRETAEKIDRSIKSTATGVQVAAQVAETFQDINRKVVEITTHIGEIATASTEQSQGLAQINSAVAEVDKVTQSNAASAEETASASEELNAQTQTMAENIRSLERLVGGSAPAPAAVRLAAPTPIRRKGPAPTGGLRKPVSSHARNDAHFADFS